MPKEIRRPHAIDNKPASKTTSAMYPKKGTNLKRLIMDDRIRNRKDKEKKASVEEIERRLSYPILTKTAIAVTENPASAKALDSFVKW